MAKTAQATAETQAQQDDAPQARSKTQAQSAEFSQAPESGATAGGSIDILLDMSIPVTVTIGRTQMPIRRLLQLGPGSVVQLNKPIDAPADLYLKDTKFATGSIVVVDGQFAVRIKEILGLAEAKADTTQR